MKEYITGIGGVFFRGQDPAKTMAWYREHLGLDCNQWGKTFEWKQTDGALGTTQWTVFKSDTDYYGPSGQQFMVNYRVRDLEELLEKLKGEGIYPVKPMESHEYGKFAWIDDADGYRIELWEPIDEGLGL